MLSEKAGFENSQTNSRQAQRDRFQEKKILIDRKKLQYLEKVLQAGICTIWVQVLAVIQVGFFFYFSIEFFCLHSCYF